MAERRIDMVKMAKNGRVIVEYAEMNAADDWGLFRENRPQSERPAPSFVEAIKALNPFAAELLEEPNDADLRVYQINFSHIGDLQVMGVTMNCMKHLANSVIAVNMNTPFKTEDFTHQSHNDERLLLSDDCIAALGVVIQEAQDYINGKRDQIEMQLEDQEESQPDVQEDSDEEQEVPAPDQEPAEVD